MARRSSSRRKYIKIGWIALGFVIVFGVIANIDQTFVPTFEAIPFGVPIPLSVLQSLELFLPAECDDPNAPTGIGSFCGSQSLISCRVWTEGIIETETSQNVVIRTRADFDTQIFDPDISGLSVLDIRTGNELNKADLDIRMRCDSTFDGQPLGIPSELLDIVDFTLTGGTVTTQWVALDSNNRLKTVTSLSTAQLPTNVDILLGESSSGVLIAKSTVTGKQIDDALTSSTEIYFTKPTLVITLKPDFNFKIGSPFFINDQSNDVVVVFNSGIGNVKIFNQVLDLPTPSSEKVDLLDIIPSVSPLKDDTDVPSIEIRISLEQWQEAEGSPRFTISRPSSVSTQTIVVQEDVPLTGRKLVDSSTNTYEFFTKSFLLRPDPNTPEGQDGKLVAGNWLVEASHPARSGTDATFFSVVKTETQGGGTTKEQQGCEEGFIPPKFTPFNSSDCIKKDPQTPDPPSDDGVAGAFNFLALGDFIDCITGKNNIPATECINDQKFFPIFAILGIIILLGVLTGRRG